MHRTLTRQLKKLRLDRSASPDLELWQSLLETVDTTYQAADQDRYTLERSLTISSEEMQALYQKQRDSYESRLSSILNAIPDVLFLLSEEGKCLDIMSGNKELLERYTNLGLGKYAHEVYSPQKAEVFYKAINQALESGELVVVNYDLDIDDQRHYFEGRIMPAQYEYEGKRTVVFIAIDITKRVNAEVQSQLISTVFENSKDGMLIVDHKFQLVSVNAAFCELNNESMDTIGDAILDIKEKLLRSDKGAMIAEAVDSEGHWIGEVSGYNEKGEAYPLWLSINTVKDPQGNVTNYVLMLSDVSAIKRSQEELVHVATHDSLTDLPNRILFQDRLQQAIRRGSRGSNIGALFFLDLDRFKNINDNLGHQVGDELLVKVASRLSTICRSTDTLARLGGDEFTLIVEGIDNIDELAIVAEKILNVFAQPFSLCGYSLEISVSIGISVFPRDSNNPDELIKHADTAMYSAKELGRNTYQFYTQELTSNAFEYFAIEIALRKAIQNEEFFLVYQPQYDLNTNQIVGVEALLRWKHPDMGVVSPARFIPIAETTGQIEMIGEWVIAEACKQCAIWEQVGMPDLMVSLNVSRKQLIIPNLSDRVKKILKEKNISGNRLEFEITESSILDNKDIVYGNLKAFKEMGISMAIDDFGTGFSSLVNLKQFPLSRLKIDQSFVRDVMVDANDEAIIRATIALGKSLQLDIIAEGVEKEEQRDFLIREGCEQAQGFFYSEPVLPEVITELFHAQQGVFTRAVK